MLVKTMRQVFRTVCVDAVREELEDDPEALADVKELAADLEATYAGYGVLLDPETYPDRLLWFGPDDRALVLVYDEESIEPATEFASWVESLFRDDGG